MIKPEEYKQIWANDETLGITFEQVKASHTLKDYHKFCSWFAGQTGGVGDDGKMYVYVSDYERWLRQGKKNRQGKDWD